MIRALDSLRRLVLGETWALPVAITILVGSLFAVRELVPEIWEDAGGLVALAGGLACLAAVTRR